MTTNNPPPLVGPISPGLQSTNAWSSTLQPSEQRSAASYQPSVIIEPYLIFGVTGNCTNYWALANKWYNLGLYKIHPDAGMDIEAGWAGGRDTNGNIFPNQTNFPPLPGGDTYSGMSNLLYSIVTNGIHWSIVYTENRANISDAGSPPGVGIWGYWQQDSSNFCRMGFNSVRADSPKSNPGNSTDSSRNAYSLGQIGYWMQHYLGYQALIGSTGWNDTNQPPVLAQGTANYWYIVGDLGDASGAGDTNHPYLSLWTNWLSHIPFSMKFQKNGGRGCWQAIESSFIYYSPFYFEANLMNAGPMFIAQPYAPGEGLGWLQETNIDMIKAWHDPLGVPGWQIVSNANGLAECWMRPMDNGDRLVWMFNKSTNVSDTIGFSTDLISWPAGALFKASELYFQTNCYAMGTFTNTLPGMGSVLFRMHPVDSSSLMLTSRVSTNSFLMSTDPSEWTSSSDFNKWVGTMFVLSNSEPVSALWRYSVNGFTNTHVVLLLNGDLTTNAVVVLPTTTLSNAFISTSCSATIAAGATNYLVTDVYDNDQYKQATPISGFDPNATTVYAIYAGAFPSNFVYYTQNGDYGPVGYQSSIVPADALDPTIAALGGVQPWNSNRVLYARSSAGTVLVADTVSGNYQVPNNLAVGGTITGNGNGITIPNGVFALGPLYILSTNGPPPSTVPDGCICLRSDIGAFEIKSNGVWTAAGGSGFDQTLNYILSGQWTFNNAVTFNGNVTIQNTNSVTQLAGLVVTNGAYGIFTNRQVFIPSALWTLNSGATPLLSQTSQSPSPYYWEDGISEASAGTPIYFKASAPEWVTNVSGYVYVQCSGVQAATNTFYSYYRSWSAGRVVDTIQTVPFVFTNGMNLINWTNLPCTATNLPHTIIVNIGASTNTASRYVIAPLVLTYN